MLTKLNMKFLLSICLLLISIASAAVAQQSSHGRASVTRAEITGAERRLSDLGYWTGAVDGILDPATRTAVIAFQKWEGRPITGKLTLEEIEAIRTSAAPNPRETGYEHVEVDIDRQVLLIVNEEGGLKILPVATGTNKAFVYDGQTSIAYTPRGRFVVYDKGVGWDPEAPRAMYYSNYISGGIAIHGSPKVPVQPASQGCIRIPMFAAREVSRMLKLGTIVLVYDKVSFVSGKSWAENPKLKEAALGNAAQN
jgi:peptidoglycan hydrolase-like protein with peptidoglycan-binding domain